MTALLDAIRSKTDRALASGDLSPLETSETVVEQNGLRFIVRWAEALARKDAAKAAAPAAALLGALPRACAGTAVSNKLCTFRGQCLRLHGLDRIDCRLGLNTSAVGRTDRG